MDEVYPAVYRIKWYIWEIITEALSPKIYPIWTLTVDMEKRDKLISTPR